MTKKIHQAIKTLSKQAESDAKHTKFETLGGAYFDYGNTQITNGFWAYINDNIIDDLVVAPIAEHPDFNTGKIIEWDEPGEYIDIDRELLAKKYKDKKELFDTKDAQFNTTYVYKMAKCFDDSVKIKLVEKRCGYVLLFFAEDSKGAILSIRKKGAKL